MRRKWGIWAVLLLTVVNLSALATFAYNRWAREPAGRPGLSDAFARELCLSGPQLKCLKDFRFAFDSETDDIQKRMEQKKLALVAELEKPAPENAALDKLIEDISGLQAEIQKKAVKSLLREKAVLTDEQKATFFRLFENHLCPRAKKAAGGAAARGPAGCPQAPAQ